MDLHHELISLVFQVLILFAAPSTGCKPINLNTFILPVFKDKSVSDLLLSTHSGTRHWWMCTLRCGSDTRCISYQFNNLTNTCSLFGCGFSDPDKTFLPTTEEAGWQLYGIVGRDQSFGYACTTSGDCAYGSSFCRDGRCECGLGYSYDPNTERCETHCDVYGNIFQKQSDVGIWGHNQETYTDKTYTECLKACVDVSNYVCRSIEIDSNNYCTLSDASWFSVSPDETDVSNSQGWELVSRHCAVTTGY